MGMCGARGVRKEDAAEPSGSADGKDGEESEDAPLPQSEESRPEEDEETTIAEGAEPGSASVQDQRIDVEALVEVEGSKVKSKAVLKGGSRDRQKD